MVLSSLLLRLVIPYTYVMGIFYYPYFLLVFWIKDVIFGSIVLSKNILAYWLDLVSLRLLLRSFFKPLKNEYRDGLVIFSILMGMIVKTILMIAILIVTLILLLLLLFFVFVITFSPILIILMLF